MLSIIQQVKNAFGGNDLLSQADQLLRGEGVLGDEEHAFKLYNEAVLLKLPDAKFKPPARMSSSLLLYRRFDACGVNKCSITVVDLSHN